MVHANQKDDADKERKIDNLVKIARFKMTQKTPFFGILASELVIIPAPPHLRQIIRTAGVTPTGLCMYNPDFIDTLKFEEICGVLAHEALHPALDFFGRFEGKNPDIANKAHDYAINLVIKDNHTNGIELPPKALLSEDYRNMSAEAIYLHLENKERTKDNQQGQGNNYTLEGDVNSNIIEKIEKEYYQSRGQKPTEEEIKERREQAKQRWRDTLEQAVIEEQKSGKGNLPQWMVTEINGILYPKLNIKQNLRHFFGRFGHRSDCSFKKRNRRNTFFEQQIPFPGRTPNKPCLYMLLDTSGSMWDEEGSTLVKGALGLIKKLVNNGGYSIRIIMCDTEVKTDIDFATVMKAVNQKKLELLGGGGSNFCPAFEYIWRDAVQNNSSQAPIICLTDGYITVPEKQAALKTRTLWITPKGVNPPTHKWGTHSEMIF